MLKIFIFLSAFISGIICTTLMWYGLSLALFGLWFILFDPAGWIFAMFSLMTIFNLVLLPLVLALIRAYILLKRGKIKGFNCGSLVALLVIAAYVGSMVLKMIQHQIIKPL